MARESLFAGGAVVVLGVTLLAAALVPGTLAEPTDDVRSSRMDIADTTLAAGAVGGESATLTVSTYLQHSGATAENVTVVYRAIDTDTGLVATTVRREVGSVSVDGELAVTANLTVERQGGYRIETLVYQDERRIETGRTTVNGVGTLQPGYARSPVKFHRFETVDLPAVQYSIETVRDNRTTLSVTTLLTNEGDAPAGDLRVVVTARQADSNIVAARSSMRISGVEPGRTVTPSTRLTVATGYNYHLDALLYKDGVIVGTAQSAANLDPTETISTNQTRRKVGLQVEDFERSDPSGRDRGRRTATPTQGEGPGFGVAIALVAVALFGTAVLGRRWFP